MANQSKQQNKSGNSNAVFQQGQRNLNKRDFKQALKDARVCYRQSPLQEHRVLLEQASIGRVLELVQAGLKPQALDIVQELLAQPVVTPEVRQEMPSLLSQLGLLERYPEYRQQLDADPALKAKLTARAADMAVLQFKDLKGSPAELREGASLVLSALEKLDLGQSSECLESLKEISRQSPFADWKLFVRGLAAYYANDNETAEANWRRLEPGRMAIRITELLKTLHQPGFVVPSDPNLANALAGLEGVLWGAPLLSDFRHLKQRAGAGEMSKAALVFRNMRDRLRVIDPRSSQAITNYLISQAVTTSNRELLKDLTIFADPMPWDPNWNHARAQLYELERPPCTQDAVRAWSKYLVDLDQVRCWTDDEVQLAKAIIYSRLGDIAAEIVGEYESGPDPEGEMALLDPQQVAEFEISNWDAEETSIPRAFFERKALQAFQSSLALRPDIRETHHKLCSLWNLVDKPEKAAEARQNLLKYFPDDLPTLAKQSVYLSRKQDYTGALELIQRMLQLKPLDEAIRRDCWLVRMLLFNAAFLKQDWSVAGLQLSEAEEFNGDLGLKTLWLVRKILWELAQGNSEKAEALVKQGVQLRENPVVFWYFMADELRKLNRASPLIPLSEVELAKAMEAPFDPEAAGWICHLITHQIVGEGTQGVKESPCVTALVAYLKRGKKSSFDLNSLRHVATFLSAFKQERPLLEHYLKHGRGRFPTSGFFSCFLGMSNFSLGPEKCDREHVKNLLNDAQTKILALNDPVETPWLPKIREILTYLEDLEEEEEESFE